MFLSFVGIKNTDTDTRLEISWYLVTGCFFVNFTKFYRTFFYRTHSRDPLEYVIFQAIEGLRINSNSNEDEMY